MKRPVRRSSAARRTGRDKTERVIRPVPAGTDGTASLRLQPARKNVTSRSDLVERLAAGRTQKLHPVGPGDRPSRLGNARRIAGRDTDRSGRADRNAHLHRQTGAVAPPFAADTAVRRVVPGLDERQIAYDRGIDREAFEARIGPVAPDACQIFVK